MSHVSCNNTSQKWVDGFTSPAVLLENFAKELSSLPQSNLLVVITTDRGLCGGVNSSLARVLKTLVPNLDKAKKDVQVKFYSHRRSKCVLRKPEISLSPHLPPFEYMMKLFIIGDKGRATMGRPLGEFITQINSDSGAPYNFSLVS